MVPDGSTPTQSLAIVQIESNLLSSLVASVSRGEREVAEAFKNQSKFEALLSNVKIEAVCRFSPAYLNFDYQENNINPVSSPNLSNRLSDNSVLLSPSNSIDSFQYSNKSHLDTSIYHLQVLSSFNPKAFESVSFENISID
jgi:vacuolar-type H+-ATPase subunit D/Vma8